MGPSRDGDSRGYAAVATSIAFVVVAGTFVSIRCAARLALVRRCGADDLLIIVAIGLSAALTALIAIQQKHGLGKHFDTLSTSEFRAMLKPFWASVVVYNSGLACTKCSILCQYLRFFVGTTPRRVCWCILAVMAAHGLCSFFGSIFACTPIAFFWNTEIPGGHCINLMAFWFSNAAFNIISDLTVCILPIPVLKSLNLPKKQKIGLILVFILGGFGCITSILRLHSLYVIAHSTDVTWDNVGAATWSSVELNVGIVCACLPTLKPVLSHFFPRLLHSRQRDTVELRADKYIRHGAGSDGRRYTGGEIHRSQRFTVEHTTWDYDDTATATSPSTPSKTHKYSWSTSSPQDNPKSPGPISVHEANV